MRLKRGCLSKGEVSVVLEELSCFRTTNSKGIYQIFDLASETEITNLSGAVLGHQNVCWLEITVNYAGTVHVIQATKEVVHDSLHMVLSDYCL